MSKTNCRILIMVPTVFMFLFSVAAWSQTEQAGITGTVRDSQSGAVPDALVEVVHEDTRLVRTTRTSDSGTFFIGGLAVGDYAITITHSGFDKAESKGIRLFVGQIRTVDVTLQVAGRAEEVSVSTKISEIERISTSLGGNIDQTQ